MGRPKKNIETKVSQPEQFELPHMPQPELKEATALERAILQRRRDPSTGLLPGLEYKFTEDGLIDWRKMLKPEHLVPNKDRFPADTDFKSLDVTELPDEKVLVLLAGFKHLARIKGYTSINYTVGNSGPDFCSAVCTIDWIGNIESSMVPVTTSAIGDAHFNNTSNFAKYYCASICENRSFVRACKAAMGINSLGFDEIGETPTDAPKQGTELAGPSPSNVLDKVIQDHGLSFEKMRARYIDIAPTEEEKEAARGWTSTKDISPLTCLFLIDKIKKAAKK